MYLSCSVPTWAEVAVARALLLVHFSSGASGGTEAVMLPPASAALLPQRKNDHGCLPPWLTGLGIYFCYQQSQHEESTPPAPLHLLHVHYHQHPSKLPPGERSQTCSSAPGKNTANGRLFFFFLKRSMNNSFLYRAAFILFKRKLKHNSLLIMDDIDQDVDGGIRLNKKEKYFFQSCFKRSWNDNSVLKTVSTAAQRKASGLNRSYNLLFCECTAMTSASTSQSQRKEKNIWNGKSGEIELHYWNTQTTLLCARNINFVCNAVFAKIIAIFEKFHPSTNTLLQVLTLNGVRQNVDVFCCLLHPTITSIPPLWMCQPLSWRMFAACR